MPEVSVIVPVYNVETYLRNCIDSILAQTFDDFELILVDDGSPDGCPAICDEYARIDSRVKVIHKSNGGLSSARNTGMSVAMGEYILFCDSDDYVSPLWCEKMIDVARKYPTSFISCELIKTAPESHITFEEVVDNHPVALSYFELYKRGLSGYVCNKIYRSYILRENGIVFDEKCFYAEDVAFNVSYCRCCNECVVITDCLYAYVQNPESIMHKYRSNLLELYLPLFKMRLPVIAKDDVCDYCDNWLYYFITLFDNVFDKRNSDMKFWRKLAYNAKIMHSDEIKFCFENATWKNESAILKKVLRTRNYFLYYTFSRMIKAKNALFNKNK